MDNIRQAAWSGLWLLGAIVLCCPGCQKDDRCFVEGMVTQKGTPFTPGEVVFFEKSLGVGGSAELNESGHYKLGGALKPGTYLVTLAPPAPPAPTAPPSTGKVRPIPEKYRTDAKTPLRVELKPGENRFDVEVTED